MSTKSTLFLGVVSCIILLSADSSASTQEWDSINLENDLIKIQVVPKIGGRVIQYKLGDYAFFWVNEDLAGKEIPQSRLGPNGEWLNYGGDKVWPAPQGQDNEQQWPGPPDPVLDGGPYTAEVIRKNDRVKAIRMTSEEDERSGIQFSRKFKIFDDSTRVSIEATMENIDTKPRRWGVWVVTQFDTSNRHGDGHNKNYWAYCPINPDSMYHKGYNVMFGLVGHLSYKPEYENGMMRVHYDYRVGKIGMDSSAGWIATMDATDGYVFVHRFTYEPGRAYPDNASVEFWLNGPGEIAAWGREIEKMPDDTAYLMESEVLSPFASLEPGESYTFRYDWYTAKVPPGSAVVTCSDIGVTCKPLSAMLCNGKVTLDGDFGIFYKGICRLVFLDRDGNEIKKASDKLPVTPLEPLILSKIKLAEGIKVPENAARLAVYIYDTKGKSLGELARTEILH
ncbi:MAG: DUF4380 domain-containing protein [Planctomycetota bacterium]|jgi:hypothetical protein